MTNQIFITTTLPYANSTPHVGHCLEFVQADALARFYRKKNIVKFNIGLDEHGLKIYQAAKANSQEPLEFVNDIAEKWYDFCKAFNISYDNFYRTSDKAHYEKVQEYWSKLVNRGDIYKKTYHAKYCIGCEEFKTETQIVNGKCDVHVSLELQDVAEENWFFKLSKYKEPISVTQLNNFSYLNHSSVRPISKLHELSNLIEDAKDISVSRLKSSQPWGVPVPNDETQTIYVWFDALLNYLFACGVDEWNSCRTIQLCGPDNLKFQALIWQALLLADDNKQTSNIYVHGTILDKDGQKMSKSVGNVISPIKELEKFGIDALRYYILKGIQTFDNSNWNSDDIAELYNADLANNFGNLLARVLHLIESKNITIDLTKIERIFSSEIGIRVESIQNDWKSGDISYALEKTRGLVSYGNKYINDQKPWSNPETAEVILTNLYYLLCVIAELYEPVIPDAIFNVKKALIEKKKAIIFARL